MKQLFHLFLKNVWAEELGKIYMVTLLRSIALYIVYIFIPIYLFEQGFKFKNIIEFYLVLRIVDLLFIPLIGFILSQKINVGFLISLSFPFLLFFYFGLKFFNLNSKSLFLLGSIYGAGNALFWYGYHLAMSKFTHQFLLGKEIAFSIALIMIASISAPLLSGILIDNFGIESVVTLAFAILLIATTLASQLKISDVGHINLKHFKESFSWKSLAFIADGFESAILESTWPIIAFLVTKSFSGYGLAVTLSYLFGFLINLWFSSRLDRNKKSFFNLSVIINFFTWLNKIFANKPVKIYVLDSIQGIFRTNITIGIDHQTYTLAKSKSINSIVFIREFLITTGFVIFYSLVYFLNLNFYQAIIISLIISPLYFFLRKD